MITPAFLPVSRHRFDFFHYDIECADTHPLRQTNFCTYANGSFTAHIGHVSLFSRSPEAAANQEWLDGSNWVGRGPAASGRVIAKVAADLKVDLATCTQL